MGETHDGWVCYFFLFVIIYTFKVFTADDINEDRMIALRKRAEVDSKYVVFVNPNDASELMQSLHRHFIYLLFPWKVAILLLLLLLSVTPLRRLRSFFSELANTYYKDEGRKVKTRIEKRTYNSTELNIRYCFKVSSPLSVSKLNFFKQAPFLALGACFSQSKHIEPFRWFTECLQQFISIRRIFSWEWDLTD